jgi:SMODS and SLOG-associating 2TM effector domain 1/SMODS and SLOG-associating 2TM effector domain 3
MRAFQAEMTDNPTAAIPLVMPPLHERSDELSLEAQQNYLSSSLFELGAMNLAAVVAATSFTLSIHGSQIKVPYAISGMLFAVALLARLRRQRRGHKNEWFLQRALAESTKSLAWRYAMGGQPFPKDLPAAEASALFRARTRLVISGPDHIPDDSDVITRSMVDARASSLNARKATYLTGRIVDQYEWYTAKARYNRRREVQLGYLGASVQITALFGAALSALSIVNFDTLGVCAATTASLEAYAQLRQHRNLATAYEIAARDLNQVEVIISNGEFDESEWSTLVDDAEEAISREHTSWLATKPL